LRDGSRAGVNGSEMAGGIGATFYSDMTGVVVADAGDYICPSDVRFEPAAHRLYVVALRLAGGIRCRSYLFEFDSYEQRLLAERRINDRQMPAPCSDAK
jgi:hypothetical protein